MFKFWCYLGFENSKNNKKKLNVHDNIIEFKVHYDPIVK
jgi:hypothetical protein